MQSSRSLSRSIVYCQSKWSNSFKLPSAPVIKSEPKFQRQLFSDLVTDIKHRNVRDMLITPDKHKIYYVNDDGVYRFSNYDSNNEFWRILLNSDDTHIDVDYDEQFGFSSFISNVFIILLIGSIIQNIVTRVFTNLGGMNKSSFDIQHHIDTVFADVQGIDDAKDELEEIVDF